MDAGSVSTQAISKLRTVDHCNEFRRCALCVGQMRFADPLADRDDDAFPADHRAQPQCDGHCDLDPSRNEFRGAIELFLVRAK
jgi:hypothetical protein